MLKFENWNDTQQLLTNVLWVLTEKASQVAEKIGKVRVNVGGTSCKVPIAVDHIRKVKEKDKLGKKRKMARC